MLNEKVNQLFENEEFAEKFAAIEDYAEMKELFAAYGVELSDEELVSFLEAAVVCAEQTDGELSDTEMESVSGGFVGWIIAGAAMGVVGGVCAYKLRKMINSGSNQCR